MMRTHYNTLDNHRDNLSPFTVKNLQAYLYNQDLFSFKTSTHWIFLILCQELENFIFKFMFLHEDIYRRIKDTS